MFKERAHFLISKV